MTRVPASAAEGSSVFEAVRFSGGGVMMKLTIEMPDFQAFRETSQKKEPGVSVFRHTGIVVVVV